MSKDSQYQRTKKDRAGLRFQILRAGYFYEHPSKGDRQYLSLGLGLRYNVFNLDFAYLVANQQESPLANTLRFSLVFNFRSNDKVKDN